jgi:hypothetical protein
LDVQIKSGRSKVLHTPPEMTGLQEANMTNLKPEPVFSNAVQHNWFFPDDQKIAQVDKQNLAWVLSRLQNQGCQVVPGWSGFNQKVSSTDPPLPPVTVIGPMPILNTPAHKYGTLWTVLQNCQAMTKSTQS